MTTYYKFLSDDGTPAHGGTGQWYLPVDNLPGEWMTPASGELVPCENGYHLCTEAYLLDWLKSALYIAECRGEMLVLESGQKVVVREARLLRRVTEWNECNARLFACDCAEHVLPIFERDYPNDKRPRQSIEVARRFAMDKATAEELSDAGNAARAAASSAVRSAAREAARAAARAAARDTTWEAAWDAARTVAWAATRAVTWDADWDAAWDAERKWQLDRLMLYLRK